jgi:hypothetical protein
VLIGRGLQSQARFAPRGREQRIVVELVHVVARVDKEQAEARDVARGRIGLQPLNSASKILASHGAMFRGHNGAWRRA